EVAVLFRRAKPHDVLHQGTVVPAPVEKHDLACRREVRKIALDIQLAFLTVGWRGKRDHPENARTDPFGNCFDGSALARAVTSLKNDDDPFALMFHPFLEDAELRLQADERFFIVFALQFWTMVRCVSVLYRFHFYTFRNRQALIANRMIANTASAARFGHRAFHGAFFNVTPRTIVTM